jgi:hypothetical protein
MYFGRIQPTDQTNSFWLQTIIVVNLFSNKNQASLFVNAKMVREVMLERSARRRGQLVDDWSSYTVVTINQWKLMGFELDHSKHDIGFNVKQINFDPLPISKFSAIDV